MILSGMQKEEFPPAYEENNGAVSEKRSGAEASDLLQYACFLFFVYSPSYV